MVDVDCRVAGASIRLLKLDLRHSDRKCEAPQGTATSPPREPRSVAAPSCDIGSALARSPCSAAAARSRTSLAAPRAPTPVQAGACSRIPEETAGPYPGDGSNGANVLNQTGVVRQDIRSSFAGLSGSATGVPLVIQLTLVSASTLAAHPGVQRRLRAGARDSDREHRVRAGCSVYCGRLSGGSWVRVKDPDPLALSAWCGQSHCALTPWR